MPHPDRLGDFWTNAPEWKAQQLTQISEDSVQPYGQSQSCLAIFFVGSREPLKVQRGSNPPAVGVRTGIQVSSTLVRNRVHYPSTWEAETGPQNKQPAWLVSSLSSRDT